MQHTQGLDAVELHGDAAVDAITEGMSLAPIPAEVERAEFERILAIKPAIPSAIAKSIAWFAPPSSSVHKQVAEDEAACIRADLAYNHMKNSGELLRQEIQRAQALERQWGVL